MKKLEGKWAVVTGSSRGVGSQIAQALAAEGCKLILHSRETGHTDALAARLRQGGSTVHQVAAELSDSGSLPALAEAIVGICGCPDILYNNAAIMTAYHGDWLVTVPSEYELSFRVNVIAPVFLANRFLPGMMAKKWGRIVNLTSGIKDQPELMAYAASKAALDKVVLDTAPKLAGSGVTLNLLDPGWLRTDLGGPQAPGAVESVLPGALVPVLATDGRSGILFRAQDFFKA